MSKNEKRKGCRGEVWEWLGAHQRPIAELSARAVAREIGREDKSVMATMAHMAKRNEEAATPEGQPFPGLTKLRSRKGFYCWSPTPAAFDGPVAAGLVPLVQVLDGESVSYNAIYHWLKDPENAKQVGAVLAPPLPDQTPGRNGKVWWVDPDLIWLAPIFGSAAVASMYGVSGKEVKRAIDSGDLPSVTNPDSGRRYVSLDDAKAWYANRPVVVPDVLPEPVDADLTSFGLESPLALLLRDDNWTWAASGPVNGNGDMVTESVIDAEVVEVAEVPVAEVPDDAEDDVSAAVRKMVNGIWEWQVVARGEVVARGFAPSCEAAEQASAAVADGYRPHTTWKTVELR